MATPDPLAPLEAVATNAMFSDPAIDDGDPAGEIPEGYLNGPERMTEYRKTRALAALSFRAEPKPTVFVLKGLLGTAVIPMEGMNATTRNMLAFASACHEIRLPDGAVLRPTGWMSRDAKAMIADDPWINAAVARWGVETVYEMGRVAYERARLPRDARGPFSWWGG